MNKDYNKLVEYAKQDFSYFNGHKNNYNEFLKLFEKTRFRDGRLVYTIKNSWSFEFWLDFFGEKLLLQIAVQKISDRGIVTAKNYLKFPIQKDFRFDSELKYKDVGFGRLY